ncbi:hypothetical protein IJ541_00450 [bacterium]|nr:hypothetical protein [bacterium]
MNREDEIAVFLQNLKDVQSSLKVLHSAVKNEFEPPELKDIENSLEIITSKYAEVIEKTDSLFEND